VLFLRPTENAIVFLLQLGPLRSQVAGDETSIRPKQLRQGNVLELNTTSSG
jgi:hypothetical protein